MGGLEFSQTQKGAIMGIGTGILYFLPVLTGAIADRYGYKRMLTIAFFVYFTAFLLLPMFHTFTGVFVMYLYLAIGAALFKPIISATIAKTTNPGNASIGFGLFYMMVNIGAFLGPMLALLYRSNVFYISAGMIALNFVMLLLYKEPERKQQSEPLWETFKIIFANVIKVLTDWKFVIFLFIISGFWGMYNQLFYTLPVFVEQWVDTSSLYHFFKENIPFITEHYSKNGQMEAEFVTNFDALFIIIFQVIISKIVMKLKPLNSIITGILIASIGMSLTLFTQNVIYTIVAMLVFSVGEMAASPKITEYIGSIAPNDKKALYMGYAYLPLFLGNVIAGILSGSVYQNMSDKYQMVMQIAKAENITLNNNWSLNEKLKFIAEQKSLTVSQFEDYLWHTNQPYKIWIVILSVGLVSAVSLLVFNALTRVKTE